MTSSAEAVVPVRTEARTHARPAAAPPPRERVPTRAALRSVGGGLTAAPAPPRTGPPPAGDPRPAPPARQPRPAQPDPAEPRPAGPDPAEPRPAAQSAHAPAAAVGATTAPPADASCAPPTDASCAPPAGPAVTLAERRALTHAYATRYARAGKQEKSRILDRVCAATGWHRSHARRALLDASRPRPARPARGGRTPYDADVVAALTFCWTILDMPAGKRLAPVLPELVPVLRRHGELAVDDETAALLTGMSAATIDRRLAPLRRGSGGPVPAARIRPGSLLRDEPPLLTWTEWDHTRPGFLEVAVVHHDAGGGRGGHGGRDGHLLTVSATDIATGWSENRTVRAVNWLPYALDEIAGTLPFPVLGIESGDGDARTGEMLLRWCEQRRVTLTRARPSRSGNHHVGQKNWSTLHAVAAGHRYDTRAQALLLNRIWAALSQLTNHFCPQQHSVRVTGPDGRRRKEYDTATPLRRTQRHPAVSAEDKAILADTHARLNPAALHRRVRALTGRLHLTAEGAAVRDATGERPGDRAPGAAS
ncbi:hypothetical protein [Streptomyces sp. DH12]|uniref:hypothetical protein n=1 Tax=Streptomyces sp. DH12 TaxID=2857010 RepID=UPI001E291A11|nr:hypothetical protein [Streptomyces sp. DH12]